MIRRFCRKCGSTFFLDDNAVHHKCATCRSPTVAPPKPSASSRPKGKGKAKNKP